MEAGAGEILGHKGGSSHPLVILHSTRMWNTLEICSSKEENPFGLKKNKWGLEEVTEREGQGSGYSGWLGAFG